MLGCGIGPPSDWFGRPLCTGYATPVRACWRLDKNDVLFSRSGINLWMPVEQRAYAAIRGVGQPRAWKVGGAETGLPGATCQMIYRRRALVSGRW
jgi:hypothetical protein